MRALLAVLMVSPLLLAGCDKPSEADYWTRSASGQACVKSKQYSTLMAQGTRANLPASPTPP